MVAAIAAGTLAAGAAVMVVQTAGAAPVGPVNPVAAALGFGSMAGFGGGLVALGAGLLLLVGAVSLRERRQSAASGHRSGRPRS